MNALTLAWPALRYPPALDGDDVHVWAVPLRVDAATRAAYEALLAPDERARAARLVVPGKREQSIVARGALRTLLGAYAGVPPAAVELRYEEHGRPRLAGPAFARHVTFNVTHSGDLALVACTRAGELGVDVERRDPRVEFLAVGRRFFSASEHATLATCAGAALEHAFFRCWTRKEAYLKARGTGLRLPLDAFDVTLAAGEPPRLVATRFDPPDTAAWTLTELVPASGYVGALCADGGARRIALHAFAPG